MNRFISFSPAFLRRLLRHPFSLFTLLLWTSFFTAYWLQAYTQKDGIVYAKSLATWADGAVHLTYISAMAYQPEFPSYLPVYHGQPFFYPFLADYLSSILVKLGINIFTAYAGVGLVLSLVFVAVLYKFYFTFTRNHTVASLSLNLSLASGGLGFYYFFLDKFKDGFDFTQPILKEYTLLDDFNIFWLNIITGEMLPQRPFLLGIIFGLFILTVVWKLFSGSLPPKWQLALAGLLFGLLPITHPHTLVALSLVIAWLFVAGGLNRRAFTRWLYFIIPALFLGLPLVVSRILPNSGGFFRWHVGWMAHDRDLNLIWFWFINWGLLIPTALWGLRFFPRRSRHLILPVSLIFLLSNLFLFQPYDWDNAKLLTWVYILLTPFASGFLISLYRRHLLGRLISLTLILTFTASGTIDLIRQLTPYTTIQMFSAEDIAIAQTIRSRIPPDAVVLTSDHHLHPVPTLTGRQIVSGYPGWLWSYGIDYHQRQLDITAIYQGAPQALSHLDRYGIDYVVIGPHEYGRYTTNLEFFHSHFPVALQSGAYTIFQTN